MTEPTLFDTSTPAPELVQQWWGVRLRNGAESRIVTCRTTAWEEA